MVQTTMSSLPGAGLQLCTLLTPWPQGGRVEGHGRAALSKRFKDLEKNLLLGYTEEAKLECINFVISGLLGLPSVHKFMAPKALKK